MGNNNNGYPNNNGFNNNNNGFNNNGFNNNGGSNNFGGNSGGQCNYNCKNDGSCSVSYRSGRIDGTDASGSCFSPDFGGSCSGIPPRCQQCSNKCGGRRGTQFTENV